ETHLQRRKSVRDTFRGGGQGPGSIGVARASAATDRRGAQCLTPATAPLEHGRIPTSPRDPVGQPARRPARRPIASGAPGGQTVSFLPIARRITYQRRTRAAPRSIGNDNTRPHFSTGVPDPPEAH